MKAEDEFARRGMFERVYPTHESGKYGKYFESEKYNNILLEQWMMKYQHSRDRGIYVMVMQHHQFIEFVQSRFFASQMFPHCSTGIELLRKLS
jgi:hypothetical protein